MSFFNIGYTSWPHRWPQIFKKILSQEFFQCHISFFEMDQWARHLLLTLKIPQKVSCTVGICIKIKNFLFCSDLLHPGPDTIILYIKQMDLIFFQPDIFQLRKKLHIKLRFWKSFRVLHANIKLLLHFSPIFLEILWNWSIFTYYSYKKSQFISQGIIFFPPASPDSKLVFYLSTCAKMGLNG